MSLIQSNEGGWYEAPDDVAKSILRHFKDGNVTFQPGIDMQGHIAELSLMPFAVPAEHVQRIIGRLSSTPLRKHSVGSGDIYYQVAEVEEAQEQKEPEAIFGFPVVTSVKKSRKSYPVKFGDFSVWLKENQDGNETGDR